MYMCESLVYVQECISLVCWRECGPSTSLLPCGFILPGVQPCPVYDVCVFVSFLWRMSAPGGQDSLYSVHGAVASAQNVLGTRGALSIIALSE